MSGTITNVILNLIAIEACASGLHSQRYLYGLPCVPSCSYVFITTGP